MKNFKILVQGKIRKIEMKKQITNHSHASDPRGEGGKILIKTLNPPTSLSELNPKGGKIWKHK